MANVDHGGAKNIAFISPTHDPQPAVSGWSHSSHQNDCWPPIGLPPHSRLSPDLNRIVTLSGPQTLSLTAGWPNKEDKWAGSIEGPRVVDVHYEKWDIMT